MVKLLRLVALVLALTAALPLLSSAPLFACLPTCDNCALGCKGVGACYVCCTPGKTPGCIPVQ